MIQLAGRLVLRFWVYTVVMVSLAACGDPLDGLDRLSDVNVAATDPAAVVPDKEEIVREGFFGTSAANGDTAASDQEVRAKSSRGGFLRGLFGRSQNNTGNERDGMQVSAPEDAANGDAEDAPRIGPDARDVSFGTVLPFGEIARVCDAGGKKLGTKIAEVGRRGFILYDSNPQILSKRSFYLTGFGDRCPRQFTAANALLGAPSTYEQLRFGPAGEHLPYEATDAAYDEVKSSVCGTRRKKPCGSRISRMDRSAAFLSAYEFNEHNGRWKEFLVHDGAVLAAAVKSLD